MNRNKVRFEYTYLHLQRYFYLEYFSKVNHCKNIILFLVTTILFFSTLLSDASFSNYDISELSDSNFEYGNLYLEFFLVQIIIPFLIIILVSAITHLIAYNGVHKQRLSESNQKLKSFTLLGRSIQDYICNLQYINFKNWIFIFSPDYYFAKYYKVKIKNDVKNIQYEKRRNIQRHKDFKEGLTTLQWSMFRIEKKAYIEYSNWLNISVTGIYLLFVLVFSSNAPQILLTITLLRILSRGIEIAFAFYKDVVQVKSKLFQSSIDNKTTVYINGFDSSLIRQNARLSLAIHSLVETFMIYGAAYFLFYQVLIQLSKEFVSIGTVGPTLFESLLISTTLGLFNISFGAYPNILLALIHTTQIILSAVLILLSIAQYLGANKVLNKDDEKLYAEFSLLMNFQKYHDEEFGVDFHSNRQKYFNDYLKIKRKSIDDILDAKYTGWPKNSKEKTSKRKEKNL